mgnify:FL=1
MKKLLYIALGALFAQGAITLANDSAFESERQHDRYCENVAWYELTQYEETPVGHRDYKEACATDTVNHFKIQILGERE